MIFFLNLYNRLETGRLATTQDTRETGIPLPNTGHIISELDC